MSFIKSERCADWANVFVSITPCTRPQVTSTVTPAPNTELTARLESTSTKLHSLSFQDQFELDHECNLQEEVS